MDGHMTNEQVKSHAEAVYKAMRNQHSYSTEQCRRIATEIVRMIGSLKNAKDADLAELAESVTETE